MNVLEKLEARIKVLSQDNLSFKPAKEDEYLLLLQVRDRLRILEHYWATASSMVSKSTTHDWDMMQQRPGDRAPGGSDF